MSSFAFCLLLFNLFVFLLVYFGNLKYFKILVISKYLIVEMSKYWIFIVNSNNKNHSINWPFTRKKMSKFVQFCFLLSSFLCLHVSPLSLSSVDVYNVGKWLIFVY